MMKKTIFACAASAMLLASCETDVKDSYETSPYTVCNLIVDTYDMDQPAIVSASTYSVKTNITRGVVDIKATDIILNNQKYSFETDTMKLRYGSFKPLDGQEIMQISFSKSGQAAPGSAASDIKGSYAWHILRSSSEYEYYPAPITTYNYTLAVLPGLDLSYMLSDRYSVQTFYSSPLFRGNSYVNGESGTYSTKKTDYLLGLDFEKKLASLYIYNPEYSVNQDGNFTKIILADKLPITFAHDRFYLEAAAPATTVLGVKDNKTDFISDPAIQVTDLRIDFVSPDLTEANITYKVDGKSVTFDGCSVLKGGR